MLDKLPEVLVERVLEASEKIGPERALIALQGIVMLSKTIRIIDGVLRQETVDAVQKAIEVSGLDTLVSAYVEKIEARFPNTFAAEVDEGEYVEVTPVELQKPEEEKVAPVKTRRIK